MSSEITTLKFQRTLLPTALRQERIGGWMQPAAQIVLTLIFLGTEGHLGRLQRAISPKQTRSTLLLWAVPTILGVENGRLVNLQMKTSKSGPQRIQPTQIVIFTETG